MKCHKLLYKPYRKTAPYEDFIKKEQEKQQKKKKEHFYQQILKFRQSRYPLDFLKQLENQINPFEVSLQKLKQIFSSKHPEYSNQLVNESVEHIFNRKCQESQMIKQSAIVIQHGDKFIRNGRKLIEEDFSYNFDNFQGQGKLNTSRKQSSLAKSKLEPGKNMDVLTKMKLNQQKQPLSSQRNPLTTDRLFTPRSRSDSPSKIVDMMRTTERFNELLLQEIFKQKKRFANLQQIEEGSPDDSINHFKNFDKINNFNYTDRSKQNESLHSFRQDDLIVRADYLDTGRSEVEELNFLLTSLNFQEGGQESNRSRKSKNTLRIQRQIKEQLYNARGSLKLEVVRKAIDRLKKQQKQVALQNKY